MSGALHEFETKIHYFTYGPHPPAITVKPGDTIRTKTIDARGWDENGQPVPAERLHQSPDTKLLTANPQSGPVYVEGAEPGDRLAVRIDEVIPTRGWAWSRHNPGFGALGHETVFAGPTGLGEPLPEKEFRWVYSKDLTEASVELPNSKLRKATIPLHPFLGCIGVCPRFGESISSLTPSNHGANMDCIETAPGTTVYLPVFMRGALLFFGDGHAAQGDGEACGVALETPTITTLTINLIKGQPLRWPRFENDEFIMTVGNTRPLIDAVRIAKTEMVLWLEAEYGFDRWEAFQLYSQVGRMRVGNVVDPMYTMVAKFPKKYLPA